MAMAMELDTEMGVQQRSLREVQEEDLDWVHRRSPKACNLCRKKKMSCDGNQPSCRRCILHRSPCVYTPRKPRKRGTKAKSTHHLPPSEPNNGANDSHMNDSQGRVGISMNAAHDPSLLHASSATPTGSSPMSNPEMTRQMMTRGASLDAADLDALLNGSDFPSSSLMPNSLARSSTETDLGFEQNHTQNHLPLGREVVWETQGDLDYICSLQKSTQGHQKYMGPGVVFGPATISGQEWITRVTGSTYFSDQFSAFLSLWNPSGLDSAAGMSTNYSPRFLPPRSTALTFVHSYFRGIQSAFPILDYHLFIQRFMSTYDSMAVPEDPVWCAQVNIVLAIGCRAQVHQSSESKASEEQICGLFNNALSWYSNISMGNTDLCRVQTLTLMYIFLSFSATPHRGYIILSTAVSMAYAIGLHVKPYACWNLSQGEIRQRNLLFWSLSILDMGLVYRMGRPPFVRHKEVTLNVPLSLSSTGSYFHKIDYDIGSTGNQSKYMDRQLYLFQRNIEIMQILAEVYEKAWPPSGDFPAVDKSELDQRLLDIYNEFPTEWKASTGNDLKALPQEILTPLVLAQSSIHLARYVIHLRSKILTADQFEVSTENAVLDPALSAASESAAALISMIHDLPTDQVACFWIFKSLPVFAFYVLFHTILAQPKASQCERYINLMSGVIEDTVDGFFIGNNLITDIHLTHFLTFFSRTARLAMKRSRQNQGDF